MTSRADSPEALFRSVGLTDIDAVRWGTPPEEPGPGVYLVAWPITSRVAPIDDDSLTAWLSRVQSLTVDGNQPSVTSLAERLKRFWWPDRRVVYIGLAGTSVSARVAQYYRTPLGDRRPHAGGHWLKTLRDYGTSTVWYSSALDPFSTERELLDVFRSQGPRLITDTGYPLPTSSTRAARGSHTG